MANIQDVRSLSDPQNLWSWEVEIEGISGETSIPSNIKFYAQSVTLPEFSIGQVEIPFKSQTAFFRGKDDSDQNLTITFWEDEEHNVYNFLNTWMNNIVNFKEGGGENKDDYMATIRVKTQGKDEETVTGTWVFKEAWLNNIGSVELSYDEDSNMTVEAQFTFDWHEYEQGSGGGMFGGGGIF